MTSTLSGNVYILLKSRRFQEVYKNGSLSIIRDVYMEMKSPRITNSPGNIQENSRFTEKTLEVNVFRDEMVMILKRRSTTYSRIHALKWENRWASFSLTLNPELMRRQKPPPL